MRFRTEPPATVFPQEALAQVGTLRPLVVRIKIFKRPPKIENTVVSVPDDSFNYTPPYFIIPIVLSTYIYRILRFRKDKTSFMFFLGWCDVMWCSLRTGLASADQENNGKQKNGFSPLRNDEIHFSQNNMIHQILVTFLAVPICYYTNEGHTDVIQAWMMMFFVPPKSFCLTDRIL